MTRFILIFASFIEGFSVMLLEICAPKIIAPLYGASMYVWSSVIGVSVGSLALGYFWGGRLSQKANVSRHILILVCFCCFYIFVLPFLFSILRDSLLILTVKQGSLLLALILLLPVLTCFGAMSPLIIQLLSNMSKNTAFAGFIYAISTIGGIIACIVGAFYMIPFLGIVNSIYICGFLLLSVLFVLILGFKKLEVNH